MQNIQLSKSNFPDIPEPFRQFLVQGKMQAQSKIGAMAFENAEPVQKWDEAANSADLMFLAAILLLCDE
jgi:hypothetical protein